MKITNSMTTSVSSPEFFTLLQGTKVGDTLNLNTILPALDAPTELLCEDVLLGLYTFAMFFLGVRLATVKILNDNGILAITLEE